MEYVPRFHGTRYPLRKDCQYIIMSQCISISAEQFDNWCLFVCTAVHSVQSGWLICPNGSSLRPSAFAVVKPSWQI